MSTPTQQSVTKIDGFDVYTLRSEVVEISVVPGMGAKITSLKSLRSGREWMWRAYDPPRFFLNRPEDSFAQSPLIGVDECVPSVGACEWNGRKIADHGEVWFMPWELDEEAWTHGAILTRATMPISPFRFERSVRLEGKDVQLDYRLTNLGRETEVYLWAIHPLFTIAPGDRIELPESVTQVRVGGGGGFPADLQAEQWNWPEPLPGIRLDDLDRFGEERAVKLFIDRIGEGFAAVSNQTLMERVSFLWDAVENPALGIWVCAGAWNGYYQMALEPTNVGAEYLAEAAERAEEFKPIPAGESIRWQLRLRIDQL
jgi:hypothetical protein